MTLHSPGKTLESAPRGVTFTEQTRVTQARIKVADRIPAFDFTKGLLVLFMVLYHWLNYFYGLQGNVYTYLRFLTPSFIFITGFLISHVSLPHYGPNTTQLSKRLLLRGLKLLAIFIALNIAVGLLFPDSSVRQLVLERSTVANLVAVFITGNVVVSGIGKAAAFTILVPIAYLLLGSAFLLVIGRSVNHIFLLACMPLFLTMLALSSQGLQSTNLELLTIGLLGVVCGYTPATEMKRLVDHPYAIIAAYCGYLAAITIWGVPLLLRITGVCLTLMLIYVLGARDKGPGRVERHISLLGRYSLLAYIAQIAILQLLRRGLASEDEELWTLGLSLLAGFALTSISVCVVDTARAKSNTADRLYKAIFS
jgi:peptidoglycan/LPS O-acetylase OafA/YrhL